MLSKKVIIFTGYVLSKKAVELFVEKGIPDKNKCRQSHGGAEDVEIGKLEISS